MKILTRVTPHARGKLKIKRMRGYQGKSKLQNNLLKYRGASER